MKWPILNDASAAMTVRDRPEGVRRTIARSAWSFTDRSNAKMDAGFEVGKLYEIVYTAHDPTVVGLGMSATRDLISFLKFGAIAPAFLVINLHT